MKKRNYICFFVISFLLIFFFFILIKNSEVEKKSAFSEFERRLANDNLVVNLPDDAKISLNFYDIDEGERRVVDSYFITRAYAEQRESLDADLTIFVPEEYKDENLTLCEACKEAVRNGKFGFEVKASYFSLLWKYRNMKDFEGCWR
jgi:hypothetical protein